ncbi:Rne/Rng family ribonuclease [Chengkuizengella axinellae]|uniref:Rne/Rng family ribonuclease n=1 Tax=Chengkuizengella axinellae TaxID=3064388 RepID=A0ABT9ITS5_9BACL|nr:Rne/Rng family ribonuclease [Chengkuizengella sp. 2205SS18-9]MDP5272735.1 Rne/Rng family ribonuclease [Chengkuizengella sp. 2205SS18-9]
MKRIVIHYENDLTEVVYMEDGELIEYYSEKSQDRQSVANIYKGKIVNVLPGMEAAFVDIGKGKNAFLHRDDLLPIHLEKKPKIKPPIQELVHLGQELMVQIYKEPIGKKGAKITTHFNIPGRYVVYMPNGNYVAVSRKVESEIERERLKSIGEEIRLDEEGLILRTVSENVKADVLKKDIDEIREIWKEIKNGFEAYSAPAELYHELGISLRIIRDLFTQDVQEIIIDNAHKAKVIRKFVHHISPSLVDRVKVYESNAQSIFEFHNIIKEVEHFFKSKIWLDNGGYIVVDETEALTVIDVNTGKYIGSVDLEETVYKTNLEAAETIAKLIRLRDIGGIIIVDFIDMQIQEHRNEIIQKLNNLIQHDRTKTTVIGWTNLGLLEMTRKKARNITKSPIKVCPTCHRMIK